jgi:thymidylate synthase (FAD)
MSELINKKNFLYDDNIGSVELVDFMGEDITIVNSARVSFGVHKEELDAKDKKLISYLMKHKHTSTLEHNIATFRIKVPLFIRSQHHRHRTWSYNEISRRYTDFNLEFYSPDTFRTQHKSNRQSSNVEEKINPNLSFEASYTSTPLTMSCSEAIKEHHKTSVALFDKLLESGVCKEQARGVLPQNLYTEYYATANLNNILKFISLRTHDGAQWEIQQLANSMLDIVTEIWPIAVGSYRDINSHV